MKSFFCTLLLASVALAHNSMEEVNFTLYSQLGFLIKICCMQIVQKLCKELFYISSKNFMFFRYNLTLRPKSYFVQIMKKILVFAHFVIPAILLFRAILLLRAISLNFEKKFREMDEFKVKPIIAPLATILRPALTYTFGSGLTSCSRRR